jgi:surface antigen Omp85-like protein
VCTASVMRLVGLVVLTTVSTPLATAAQEPPSDAAQTAQATSRQGEIEQEQAAKSKNLRPYTPNRAEKLFQRVDTVLEGGTIRWHPFFENAYAGGGFTLGAGHANYVSAYNYIDVRGSWTFSNYKRFEAEFVAPRLWNRHAKLSATGGWREAPEVGFFGVGNDSTEANETNYLFRQPYANALLRYYPARSGVMLRGGAEFSRWNLEDGEGADPPISSRYTPETLPGLGAEVTYFHTQGGVGFDWRPAEDYARRGGYYGVTLHDYKDNDDEFGFRMVEYEAIQHFPILRESWVLSFRARVQHAMEKDGQQTPFFMLPALGGGSSLRAYSSWRFRDENSMLLQGEWRIMVNRYLDLAFFYDTGKVASTTSDLDFYNMKDDFGVGVRFHGPFATPLRVELAKGREGMNVVFSSSAVF